MQTVFLLMALLGPKVLLTLDEVCEAIGYAKKTAYNEISAGSFPIPMQKRAGKWLADIRDVAEYLDAERAGAIKAHPRQEALLRTRVWRKG
jgi:predicted DNA-binding transcriptional regulator AlpA